MRRYKAFLVLIIIMLILLPCTNLNVANSSIGPFKGYEVQKGFSGDILSVNDEMYMMYAKNPGESIYGKYNNSDFTLNKKIGKIAHYMSLVKFEKSEYLFYFDRNEDEIKVLKDNNEIEKIVHDEGTQNLDIIIHQEILYLYYTNQTGGLMSSENLNLITYDGQDWSEPRQVLSNIPSTVSMDIHAYEDELYLFYTGFNSSEGGDSVYISNSEDGTNWSDPLWLSQGEDRQFLRDVVVHNGELYCFWESRNKDILEGKSYDGDSWSEAQTITFKSDGEPIVSTELQVELFNGKPYCFAWPNSDVRDEFVMGEFNDWKVDSATVGVKDLNNNPSTAVHDDKIWIFYDDGEYIRYITYDGESFDYAEAIGGEDEETNIIVRYWWIIALAGIVAVLVAGYGYRKRGNKEKPLIEEELDREEHL